jgi:hypothetical protein
MTHLPVHPKSDVTEITFRLVAGGLTVGLLIVLPALMILGVL